MRKFALRSITISKSLLEIVSYPNNMQFQYYIIRVMSFLLARFASHSSVRILLAVNVQYCETSLLIEISTKKFINYAHLLLYSDKLMLFKSFYAIFDVKILYFNFIF